MECSSRYKCSCDACLRKTMKRTLAITLTIALIGSLLALGTVGTATAQVNEDPDDGLVDIDDFFGDQTAGDQTTGDATATTNIAVDQNNDNAQVGVAEAEADAVAVDANDGTETLTAGATDDKHYKDAGAAGVGEGADAGGTSALAAADATVSQAQEVNQQNAAEVSDVTTIAESGDNELEQEFEVDTDVDVDATAETGDGESGDSEPTDGEPGEYAISFIAFCYSDTADATVTITDVDDSDEPFVVEYEVEGDEPEAVVHKTGGGANQIFQQSGESSGTVVAGDGDFVGDERTPSDPCLSSSDPKFEGGEISEGSTITV